MNDVKEAIKLTFGRSDEIISLEKHFSEVLNGRFSSCLISGEAGVGKTHLIGKLAQNLSTYNTHYIYSKFNHYHNNTLSLIENIIQQLVHIALTESDEKVKEISQRVGQESKEYGSLIIKICPDSEQLIGPFEAFKSDDYYKHEYAYLKAFFTFVAIISEVLFPLMIHIDDLQWADEASLRIADELKSYIPSMKVFLVFSLRNENEKTLGALQNYFDEDMNCLKIDLKRFSYKDTVEYTRKILEGPIQEEHYVLDKVFQTTLGNPYYLNHMLQQIKDTCFSDTMWDVKACFFEEHKLADSIVDTLLNEFLYTSKDEKHLLESLVCLGGSASFDLMMSLVNTVERDLKSSLDKLCMTGLLLKKQDILTHNQELFCFSHDIILDAVYQAMSDDEKNMMHYKITKQLMLQREDHTQNTILTSKQILACKDQILRDYALDSYIDVLYEASILLKENIMIQEAHKCLQVCVQLLETNKHIIEQDQRLSIMTELAEVTFISGDIKGAEEVFTIISNQRKGSELIAVKKKMVMLYTSVASSHKIMSLCYEILALLDFELDTKHLTPKIVKEVLAFKVLFSKKRINQLSGLSSQDNDTMNEIGETLIRMIAIANLTDDNLFVYLILKLCNFSVKFGTTENAIPAYAAGCFLLNSFLNQRSLADLLTVKTEALLLETDNDGIKCMSHFILGNFMVHWQHSALVGAEYLMTAIHHGMKAGDLQYAEYSYTTMIEMMYAAGITLKQLTVYMNKIYDYDPRMKNDIVNITIDLLEDHIAKLKGETLEGMSVEDLDTTDLMQSITYEYYHLQRLYLVGDLPHAFEILKRIEKHKEMYKGYYMQVDIEFLFALIRLESHVTIKDRYKNKKHIKQSLKRLKAWSLQSSEHLGRYNILLARYNDIYITGKGSASLYDRGIEFSREKEQNIVASIGCLLAAKHYHSNPKFSKLYLEDAVKILEYWGATDIATTVAIQGQIDRVELTPIIHEEKPVVKEVFKEKPLPLNVKTVDDLDLDDSLSHLLHQLLKDCKGVKGSIYKIINDKLVLVQTWQDNQSIKVEPVQPYNIDAERALKVIRYVSRTQKEVVITDHSQVGIFAYDDYLLKQDQFSIICAPLLYAHVLSGFVYLEGDEDHALSIDLLQTIHFYASILAAKELSKQHGLSCRSKDDLPLTKRELDVFMEIIKGKTNKEVGAVLSISLSTVKTHLINIYSKLEIKNRIEAVEVAVEYGLY